MAKRIIVISSLPICIILGAIALVFIGIGRGQPANATEEIKKAAENIFSLIAKGNFSEADLAANELITGFNGNPDLPEMLYMIGERYEGVNKFDQEKRVFQQTVKNYPDSPFADKARLGIKRSEAMSLIMTEKFDQAESAIDVMTTDFEGHPDFPEVLFWVTERYVRLDRFEEAKQNYGRLIQNFPDNPYASKAELWFSRINAISLIVSGDYNKAQTTIDKLAVDFAADTDLPMMLYWIAERFERKNRFEEAKRNYQRIVQDHPDNCWVDKVKLNVSWADRAKLGIARADAMSLILSGNYDQAKAVIDKMVIDFYGNPALPGTLYWTNEKYEWADKLDEAKYVYEQIIQKCPDSLYTERARLGIRRLDVMKLMASPDSALAEEALSKLIVDFNDNPEMPRAVLIVGAKCFLGAKTPDSSQRAIRILERVLYGLPRTEATAGVIADAFCCAGDCYFELGDYNNALSCHQKVTQDYAERFALAARSLSRTALIYEKLGESGLMDASEAQIRARLVYEQLLQNYPNSEDADSARVWLEQQQNK